MVDWLVFIATLTDAISICSCSAVVLNVTREKDAKAERIFKY